MPFEAWVDETVGRFSPPLTFQELRKGVRALSSLYVERRDSRGPIGERALDGAAKRAAFAGYYAPLHFLTTRIALEALGAAWLRPVRRVVDLGCGTGAAGAAAALACPSEAEVLGLDRSGFALGEARRTYAAFGLRARVRRGSLPGALPRLATGDLAVLGWAVNECGAPCRAALRAGLRAGCEAGARILVLEPLAGAVAPWWKEWSEALAPLGIEDREVRSAVTLPGFLARMDLAAGLDHRELGARCLAGPR